MDDEVASRRNYLLEGAVADVTKWCAPSDTIVLKEERTRTGDHL